MAARRNPPRTILYLAASCCFALLLLPAAGAAPHALTTTRDSVDSAGAQGNGASYDPALSADGRFVAFHSVSSNLVPGDTNGFSDVFLRDRLTGMTTRESLTTGGGQANRYNAGAAISDDGRFVAFESDSFNLVPGDTNDRGDVFVRDRQANVTERVSIATDGTQGDRNSTQAAISADGRYVAFFSQATTLVPGDTNLEDDIFVRDRLSGTTTRVNLSSTGEQTNDLSWRPSISADGRFVAFESYASNLVPGDTNGVEDVFVHDRETGETSRASIDSSGGQADRVSMFARLSADGRYLAFMTNAALVWDDTNTTTDVYVHDRETGQTMRASVDSNGLEGNATSNTPTISGDGRFVTFWSEATNLVADDTNGAFDIFVHDRGAHTTERVSVSSAGAQSNAGSLRPMISRDGQSVAFWSDASNLVAGDTNWQPDIFVRGPELQGPPPPPPPPPPPVPPPPPPLPPPPVVPPPPPPPPTHCRVPRLIGLRMLIARRKLRRASCSLGRVRKTRSRRVGRIVSQSPRPGVTRRRWSKVGVSIGRR